MNPEKIKNIKTPTAKSKFSLNERPQTAAINNQRNSAKKQITNYEQEKNKLISEGKYDEAKKIHIKIEKLNEKMKNLNIKLIDQIENDKKENINNDHENELKNLEEDYNNKVKERQTKYNEELEALKTKNKKEINAINYKFTDEYKPSDSVRNLEKQEQGLVKLNLFDEAKQVRRQKETLKKNELKEFLRMNKKKIEISKSNINKLYKNKLLEVKKDFENDLDRMKAEYIKECDVVDKKYNKLRTNTIFGNNTMKSLKANENILKVRAAEIVQFRNYKKNEKVFKDADLENIV